MPPKDPKEKVKFQQQQSIPGRTRSPVGKEFASFAKHTTGFGQKMLEKMGWKAGGGLGAGGEGVVNPIETKLRPNRMGMGFRGFDERTDQAKAEAMPSSDEDEPAPGKKQKQAQQQQQQRQPGWKKRQESSQDDDDELGVGSPRQAQRTRKKKVTYQTAHDVIANVEQAMQHQPQKVIDMTGPSIREINIADIKRTDSPTLMESTSRLPELRHNMRLLVDLSKADLENLSREKQSNQFKFTAMQDELNALQRKHQEQRDNQAIVEKVKAIANEIQQKYASATENGLYQESSIAALFGPQFDALAASPLNTHIKPLGLDALVVAAWVPKLKIDCADWDVLNDPGRGLDDIQRWRRPLLRSHDDDLPDDPRRAKKQLQASHLISTPYETMINTIWLHKVRSTINNEWDVRDPEPLIHFLDRWQTVLPRFVFENVINQLVMPKVTRAVADWDPRQDQEMVHTWIHPWLPLLKAWRLADLFTTIRHKLSVILRQWHPSDESALEVLSRWKGVWTDAQMDMFLAKCVVPKLTQLLRQDFVVNPRDQKIDPLIWTMAWHELLNPAVFTQLVETDIFPQWLRVLYKWLTIDPDNVNFDEVKEWYMWWKQVFASFGLAEHPAVLKGTRKALDMMSAASSGDTVPKAYLNDA
ncbi:GC-rich sequence DNA-binding factor-like protein-domain-containing protein [Gongronella butleri]|nr:GC-rich sequence DNA-binding factor-like protein-domain-containing protein [Gongronella butleri]